MNYQRSNSSQPIRDRIFSSPYGRRGGHEFFLGQEFEAGNELKIGRGKSARGHDTNVIGRRIHGCFNLFSCTPRVIVAIATLKALYP